MSWQREHAVATYLELEYDPRPWDGDAAAFARAGRQLLNLLLALMAYRTARLAAKLNANATIVEDGEPSLASYQHVNLGFTVQAGESLFLCVVDLADTMDETAFVARLGELQRRAMANRLAPVEMRGATVGFTSMARWGIRRHIPVLAPDTSLMVAHCAPARDGGAAGRCCWARPTTTACLTGFDVARLLQKLANPAKQSV